MGKAIVFASPVFLLLIAIELAWGVYKQRRGTGRNTYRLADAVNSISLGMLSQFTAVFTRLLRVGVYTFVYASLSLVPLEAAKAFWNTWTGWFLALVFYDLCYYWLHRAGHEVAIFWAAHVVHHQSQDYNFSTALRQTSSGALLGWVFYIPMALAGVPPAVFGAVALVDLLYQFWVHTEHVGKLGWFDRWFCSPSNHRVHHAVNDAYLDKNYGGIWMVWDRLFGSFIEEDDANRCVYGTRSPLQSWDPLWANAEVYAALGKDVWHTRSWLDKLRVLVKPPGWRPADVAARFPKPAFSLNAATAKFEAPAPRSAQWTSLVAFAILLQCVSAFLWFADSLGAGQQLVCVAALAAGVWTVGALLQGRLTISWALMLWAAMLATLSSAMGWTLAHYIAKPSGMAIAIFIVATYVHMTRTTTLNTTKNSTDTSFSFAPRLLLAALGFSLIGDVLLMFHGYFVFGLVAFLCAHLAYIALFKRGVAWFPHRGALLATLVYGAAMYAFIYSYLPAALKLPVAVYVLAIALMGAQALGRASVRRDDASRCVAIGALFFMASDTLLAINRFVTPLPVSALWVLSSYYTAQFLIARYALSTGAGGRS
ncbi:MAG: lysoplasmalogenase family protein [Burkholderiaceae bacterium]